MLVKQWMTPNVITVDEETSLMEVSQIMREKKVARVPVLNKKGRLVGIVSDRDIKAASPSKATTLDVHELYYLLSKVKIKEVMSKNPVTISPEDTVVKAAAVMLERKITGLPVLDAKGELVGILTQGDVFRVLTSITGAYLGGTLLAFEIEDRAGTIKEVADVVRGAGGGMTSILTSYDGAPAGWRHVFMRVRNIPEDRMPALIEMLKGKFKVLYAVKEEITRAKA